METPELIVKKARPFFLNYFSNLANDLNTLTAAPVVCTLKGISLVRGEADLKVFFEENRSVAYVREDGLDSGDVHLVFDVTTSIALTGLMMMMGEAVIQNQVKTREYNEEIQEGFQEVSNQVVGAMNDLVEQKMADGGHMFLEATTHSEPKVIPDSLDMETTYLEASVEIKVADFPPATASWLLSRGLAQPLLDIEIPGGPGEQAAEPEPAAPEVETPPVEADMADGEDVAVPDSLADDLPLADDVDPNAPGSVTSVMRGDPHTLKETDKVLDAINAMRREGHACFGIERQGRLIRVVTRSDLRQIMGPFFGTRAMGPRDKALCALPIGKFYEDQRLIRIPQTGTINQAADLITEFRLHALPVVGKDEKLKGFVSIHTLLGYFRSRK